MSNSLLFGGTTTIKSILFFLKCLTAKYNLEYASSVKWVKLSNQGQKNKIFGVSFTASL